MEFFVLLRCFVFLFPTPTYSASLFGHFLVLSSQEMVGPSRGARELQADRVFLCNRLIEKLAVWLHHLMTLLFAFFEQFHLITTGSFWFL